MNVVKWIAGASLAAVVTLGAVFAPGVGAQSVGFDNAAIDGSQFNRAQVVQMVRDGAGGGFDAENAFGRRGHRARGGHHMEVIAEQLGMTREEIRTELQASLEAGTPKSIADLATEQGVAIESIESAILAQMSEHLAQKVADGDITQEQADEKLANASERISERLSQPFEGKPEGRHGRRGGQQGMAVIIEQLGISGEELRAELQAGKSIADVAAEQGVSLDAIEDALMSQLSEKLAERVANGDMTQEEADEKLAEASTRIEERLTQPGGQRGQRGEEGERREQREQRGQRGQNGGVQNQDA